MDKNQMLIKLKLPERKVKVEIQGEDFQKKILYDLEADVYNECLDNIESLNQPLVRGLEIDVEAFAKEIFEICHYPAPEYWKDQDENTKSRWRTNAEIIRDNAHVWLKEVEKGK